MSVSGRKFICHIKKKKKEGKAQHSLVSYLIGTSPAMQAHGSGWLFVQLSAVGVVLYFQDKSVKYIANTFVNRANWDWLSYAKPDLLCTALLSPS